MPLQILGGGGREEGEFFHTTINQPMPSAMVPVGCNPGDAPRALSLHAMHAVTVTPIRSSTVVISLPS